MVVEALLRYKKAAYFDDELKIRTEMVDLGRASLRFEYTVLRNTETLATGHTRHGCIALATGKPVGMPGELFSPDPNVEPGASTSTSI